MTAFDGGPLRRIQLQDRYGFRVSKGHRLQAWRRRPGHV